MPTGCWRISRRSPWRSSSSGSVAHRSRRSARGGDHPRLSRPVVRARLGSGVCHRLRSARRCCCRAIRPGYALAHAGQFRLYSCALSGLRGCRDAPRCAVPGAVSRRRDATIGGARRCRYLRHAALARRYGTLLRWRGAHLTGHAAAHDELLQAVLAVTLAVACSATLVAWRHIEYGQWAIWSSASVVTGNAASAHLKLRDRGAARCSAYRSASR